MNVPLVGVVTALGRPEYQLLIEAGESLRELASTFESPDAPALQWIVCCDTGPDGPVDPAEVREALAPLGLAVDIVTTGARRGPGPARNLALARIRAPYLITLDSDDLVVPAGMATLVRALVDDPRPAWAAGRCHHVDADRNLLWVGPPDPWPAGRVDAGDFWQFKLRRGGLPFLCPAAVARTSAVRACGGWPAAARARAEDTALWAVLTSRWPGVWVPEHVYDYRRHAASVTHAPRFRELDEDLPAISRMVRAGVTSVA